MSSAVRGVRPRATPRLGGDRSGRAVIRRLVRSMGSLVGSANAFMHHLLANYRAKGRMPRGSFVKLLF